MCLVPDGDLFEAISKGEASVVTDRIASFTERGIELESGEELEADVIVTATGLNLLFLGGIELTVDGEAVDVPSKMTYKGMMLSGVPNMAFTVGYTNASWTLKADLTSEYVCRLLDHMDAHGYRRCVPEVDPSVTEQPLLDFTSGYVQRSLDQFPKQGSKEPWKLRQNYVFDIRTIRRGAIDDGAMRFGSGEAGSDGRMQAKQLLAFPVLCAVLALAVLGVAGCGGGDDDGDSARPRRPSRRRDDRGRRRLRSSGNAPAPSGDAARSAKVEIVDFAYDPDPVTIEEGGKVIWQNEDSAPHTATADDGSFDTGTLEEGKLKSETFKEAGTYAYICSIHPDMHGTVEVVAALRIAAHVARDAAARSADREAGRALREQRDRLLGPAGAASSTAR